MKTPFLIITLLAVLFVSCDKNNDPAELKNNEPTESENSGLTESESVVFLFHRNGGWIGLDEKLKITADSTCYFISYHNLQTGEFISYQTSVKTFGKQWDYLINTFDLEAFTEIQDGSCFACVDGFDETFSYTKEEETYSLYNGGKDEHYKQMQEFFDAIIAQAAIFNTYLSPSLGCSSFCVYKLNDNGQNDIGIAVMGNREKLSLSETEQTFDLSEMDVQDLKVEIKRFTSGSHGYYCNCVFEGELLDTWTSVSGTVKIKIVQDYEGNPEEFEKIYTINVILENIVLKNDKGHTIIVNQMEFNNVTVGGLPG